MAIPIVVVVENANIEYRGRAHSSGTIALCTIIIKKDGTVIIQGMDKGTKPLFYNPWGSTHWRKRKNRIYIKSISENNERLYISGEINTFNVIDKISSTRLSKRKYISGDEKGIVDYIVNNPRIIGIRKKDLIGIEIKKIGGRIDILTSKYIIEVKKKAGISTYDQAVRYLRGNPNHKVIIACLGASQDLKNLLNSESTNSVSIIELNSKKVIKYNEEKKHKLKQNGCN